MTPQVLGKEEIPPIKEILKNGIHEALEELSEYDPHVFYETSNDKLYIEEQEDLELKEELLEEGPEENGQEKE